MASEGLDSRDQRPSSQLGRIVAAIVREKT